MRNLARSPCAVATEMKPLVLPSPKLYMGHFLDRLVTKFGYKVVNGGKLDESEPIDIFGQPSQRVQKAVITAL